MSGMTIEYMDAKDITPYARNSRTHSDEQVSQVAASIKEFGWTNPILIDEDTSIIRWSRSPHGGATLGFDLRPYDTARKPV